MKIPITVQHTIRPVIRIWDKTNRKPRRKSFFFFK